MLSSRSIEEIRNHLFTGVLSDVLDSMGQQGQTGRTDLVHVIPGQSVVGRAQTARAMPVTSPPETPYGLLLEAVSATGPGKVLVIGTPEDSTSSLFGGLLATAVKAAGGEGVIVDGFARDAREIRQTGLPTVVSGYRPLDSYGRDDVVEISEPVMVAGVCVNQGDLVFSDEDGLVVVPSRIESQVIEAAFEKIAKEGGMREALAGGMPPAEAFAHFGVL